MVSLQTKKAKHRATDKKPQRTTSVLSAVLIVLGILVLLTPVVLTKLHNAEQLRIAEQYSASIRDIPTEQRELELIRAREWNERLERFELRDPWRYAPDPQSPEYQEYEEILAVNPVMSRLRVPAVGIDLPVYHGSTDRVLAQGVGHVFGSAFPIGGVGTHAALTGHTGVSTSTMFDNLNKVKPGDTFTVETLGRRIAYQVDNVKTVLPEEIDHLKPVEGEDHITLITCTPYGINSHRLLVRGVRLPDDSPALHEDVDPNRWQWWMLVAIGVSILTLMYLAVGFFKRKKGQS